MATVKLRGIYRKTKRLADGTIATYWYHRATKTRLPGELGSAEFVGAYAAAERQLRERDKGSVSGLIRDYSTSVEFEALGESTRREYRRMLTKIEEKFGTMPIAALDDPRCRNDFLSWRNAIVRKSGKREADHRLSVLSAMLTWARENGRILNNYIRGFKRLHHVDRSDKIWLPEHIETFMRVAPIELQRALILALHTGQRQGDLLRLTWGNYDGGRISLRQGKTGRRVQIPCTAALKGMLDGVERTSAVILTTKTGLPWKPRYFKAQWERASKAAGVTDLHFHDLRGTAVTLLAESGCTNAEIASITGHTMKSVSTILDKYLARTRVLSDEAITRFENAKATQFANRLRTDTPTIRKGDCK